jgi:predicted HicB family RNase H-like nuclease
MLNLRLPPDTFAALRLQADSAGISVAAYIATLLTTHIKRQK